MRGFIVNYHYIQEFCPKECQKIEAKNIFNHRRYLFFPFRYGTAYRHQIQILLHRGRSI